MTQGRDKARKQKLRAFFVTNTKGITRCYNVADMSEVSVDGQLVTETPPLRHGCDSDSGKKRFVQCDVFLPSQKFRPRPKSGQELP